MKYGIEDTVILGSGSKYTISKVNSDHYKFVNSGCSWVDNEINHKATEEHHIKNTKIEIGYITIQCSILNLKSVYDNYPNFNIKIISQQKNKYLLHITEKFKKLT